MQQYQWYHKTSIRPWLRFQTHRLSLMIQKTLSNTKKWRNGWTRNSKNTHYYRMKHVNDSREYPFDIDFASHQFIQRSQLPYWCIAWFDNKWRWLELCLTFPMNSSRFKTFNLDIMRTSPQRWLYLDDSFSMLLIPWDLLSSNMKPLSVEPITASSRHLNGKFSRVQLFTFILI